MMKKITTLACALIINFCWANHVDPIVVNAYEAQFAKAYSLYPIIPKGTLEAVAFCNTHFFHDYHPSCDAGAPTEGHPYKISPLSAARSVFGISTGLPFCNVTTVIVPSIASSASASNT